MATGNCFTFTSIQLLTLSKLCNEKRNKSYFFFVCCMCIVLIIALHITGCAATVLIMSIFIVWSAEPHQYNCCWGGWVDLYVIAHLNTLWILPKLLTITQQNVFIDRAMEILHRKKTACKTIVCDRDFPGIFVKWETLHVVFYVTIASICVYIIHTVCNECILAIYYRAAPNKWHPLSAFVYYTNSIGFGPGSNEFRFIKLIFRNEHFPAKSEF